MAGKRGHIDPCARSLLPFRDRPGGKVPCLALNEVANRFGDIQGIFFQKVDGGRVKASLPVDSFSNVNWADAPTQPPAPGPGDGSMVRALNDRLHLDQVSADKVKPEWKEFTETLANVKRAMLGRMSAASEPDEERPQYLLEGFRDRKWKGATPRTVDPFSAPKRMVVQIKEDIGDRAGNWNPAIERFVLSLCHGLFDADIAFRDVLKYLLPNCQKPDQDIIQCLPKPWNGALKDGAVRCLCYGFQVEQVARSSRSMNRNRDIRHRFMLEKRCSERSRSKSRSPSPIDERILNEDVYDPQNPRRFVTANSLLTNPERYRVTSEKLCYYFESHNPNLMILNSVEMPDTEYPGISNDEFRAKVVVEISTYKKASHVLAKHIQKTVDKCVQSCLAAMACDQDLMYGIVVVVDGFVLVKVQKQHQDDQDEYVISESDIIMWDNRDQLFSLFQILENISDM